MLMMAGQKGNTMEPKLIKIDRNGSKHYEGLIPCDRCGGHGYYAIGVCNNQPVLSPHDGGVCYQCGGSGKIMSTWIERTPEYQAKLDAKRRAKEAAKQAELEAEADKRRAEWLSKNGFTPEGVTYLFLGDTYAAKDRIKELGGKYAGCGWHIDHEVEGFSFLRATKDEILDPTYWGYEYKDIDFDQMRREAYDKLSGVAKPEYIGTVGERIKIEAKYIRSASWDVRFAGGMWGTATQYLHTFHDKSGNVLVWKTSSPIGVSEGTDLTLAGTVKEHSEYKGQKQTVLTRCSCK